MTGLHAFQHLVALCSLDDDHASGGGTDGERHGMKQAEDAHVDGCQRQHYLPVLMIERMRAAVLAASAPGTLWTRTRRATRGAAAGSRTSV